MGDSSNKSENIWKKGVAHVIDLLSSLETMRKSL